VIRYWDIVTGEYPPQPGGVADYTRMIARALAAEGDEVRVWAPRWDGAASADPGVIVNRLPDHFGPRGLARLSAALRQHRDTRLLVQYVPHAFGWKAMNVPFCLWLAAQRRAPLTIVFHEVTFPIGRDLPLRHNALGLVNRAMAWAAARAACRIFVTVPGWEPHLRAAAPRTTPIAWLPVPSVVAPADDAASSRELRRGFLASGAKSLVGHLGTYGPGIVAVLMPSMLALLRRRADAPLLLMGEGGRELRAALVRAEPRLDARVIATGWLSSEELSHHLSACDVLVQPYPDGVSGRRTSAMAALAHGVALVSTRGVLTEPIWAESRAVALAPAGDAPAVAAAMERLLDDEGERRRLASAGLALYDRRFALRHTIDALRDVAAPAAKAA
jgi:glycosyltransferase involved in cell wall biosynthesis